MKSQRNYFHPPIPATLALMCLYPEHNQDHKSLEGEEILREEVVDACVVEDDFRQLE
jgi:hypothetical protein